MTVTASSNGNSLISCSVPVTLSVLLPLKAKSKLMQVPSSDHFACIEIIYVTWTSRRAKENLPILSVRLVWVQHREFGAWESPSHPEHSASLCATADVAGAGWGRQAEGKVLNLLVPGVCLVQVRAALSAALFWVAASRSHGVLQHLKKSLSTGIQQPLNLQSENSVFSHCP